jgi:hypothetical protein
MAVRSFLGDLEEGARRFYATTVRGEISDASVRSYLRAASQIEDVWQQIDAKIDELIVAGVPPWESYDQLRYALAFSRAARSYAVFVEQLLAADALHDPATAGFLPRVTYDQANALCYQIQPYLEQALLALADANYQPESRLPLKLGPRIAPEEAMFPASHVRGLIAAAHEVREWAAGLITQYQYAIQRASEPVPSEITAHLARLQGRLAHVDSQLRFGVDLVGPVAALRQGAPDVHQRAEQSLWDAMAGAFLLNQAVAIPDLLKFGETTPDQMAANPASAYHNKRVFPDDLWKLAAPSARAELRHTPFGKSEMEKLCLQLGGVLSAGAQQYLDEMKAAVEQGVAVPLAALANCPFQPVYRARKELIVVGNPIPAGHEFYWNLHENSLNSTTRFKRAPTWKEGEA